MTRTYDMTAPEFLEGFLPGWRASLPTRLAPFAERFLRLNRGVLEVLTQRALAALRARRGELPDTVIEFAAYDPVVAHEQIEKFLRYFKRDRDFFLRLVLYGIDAVVEEV